MTRAEREEMFRTRNERRAATKDNAKKKRAKKKGPARTGGGTKKVAPGRKKTRMSPRPTKAMQAVLDARRELERETVAGLRFGTSAGVTAFLAGLRQFLTTPGYVATDPDWLGWVEAEADRMRDHLQAAGLYPKDV